MSTVPNYSSISDASYKRRSYTFAADSNNPEATAICAHPSNTQPRSRTQTADSMRSVSTVISEATTFTPTTEKRTELDRMAKKACWIALLASISGGGLLFYGKDKICFQISLTLLGVSSLSFLSSIACLIIKDEVRAPNNA